MLFVHQAPRPRATTPTPARTGAAEPRLSSRGRRGAGGAAVAGQRRPSSALGSGGEALHHRRAHPNDRVSGTTSRPGSANSGAARAAFPPQRLLSPPGSARGQPTGTFGGGGEASPRAPGGAAAGGDRPVIMPAARPVTPMSRQPPGSVRASTPTPGPLRGPSGGPTTLPLHVSNIGRPQTPTAQRRAPPSGGPAAAFGAAAPKDPSSGSFGDGGVPPPPRADSSAGKAAGDGGTAGAAGGHGGGNGSLTTVISSALDYRRFLDRRKQMLQQQVESAQQASADRQEDTDGRADGRDAPAGGGWTPGATGPVKANHNMVATAPLAGSRRPGGTVGPGALAPPLAASPGPSPRGGDSGHEEEDRTPGSARSSNSSTATPGGLRRVVPQQPGQPVSQAPTPTRYTQSSGTPGGVAELSFDVGGRSSRNSLPAGGARQACRSLGQSEQRGVYEMLARGETPSEQPPAPSAEAFGEPGEPTGTGRQKHHRDSSVDDGFLREADGSEQRGSSRPLNGNSVEDYIIGKQIGQGAYATVSFGLHKETNKKVAIKIYEKYKLLEPQRRKSVRCEIRLMERLRHPNIVVFHEALDSPKQIHIIMEFVGGGSLHHFLKKRPGRRLDDHVAKRLFFQVCQGIRYLHDRHIVHRDVKLENLLLEEAGTVKIIDFGFSTVVPPGKKLKIFCGTPSYMSPEIVARKEYSGFCADVWAMGVLLYALLCGNFPFRGQNDRDLYRKIVRGAYNAPDYVGADSRNLLGRILNVDMARRPAVDDVLADAWFSAHRDDLYTTGKAASSSGYHPNSSTSSTATTAAPSSASAGQSARETSGESPHALLTVSRGAAGVRGAFAAAAAAPRAATPLGGVAALGTQGAAPPPLGGRPGSALGAGLGEAREVVAGGAAGAAAAGEASAAQEGRPSTAGPTIPFAGAAAAAQSGAAAGAGGGGPAAGAGGAGIVGGVGGMGAGAAGALSGAGGAGSSGGGAGCAPGEARPERVEERSSRRIEEEAISKLERLGYPRDEIMRQLKDESSHLCKLHNRFLKALTAWDSKR